MRNGDESLEAKLAKRHKSHARHGLGQAMYKLASTPDTIREELGQPNEQ
jgi:hypothetical protein